MSEDATRTWLRGLQSSYDLDVTVNSPAMKWQAIRVPSVCGLRLAHLFSVRKRDGWTILRQISRNTGKTLSIFLLFPFLKTLSTNWISRARS